MTTIRILTLIEWGCAVLAGVSLAMFLTYGGFANGANTVTMTILACTFAMHAETERTWRRLR